MAIFDSNSKGNAYDFSSEDISFLSTFALVFLALAILFEAATIDIWSSGSSGSSGQRRGSAYDRNDWPETDAAMDVAAGERASRSVELVEKEGEPVGELSGINLRGLSEGEKERKC
ncbi:uncharacterized protein MONOS_10673 [Monocercomonoides exilis]|uniref:uncharacterized protein n=1 Tax=Monocercomonoides exilis TaxID=2049356 RepID=UPI00355A3E9F|nr:hypothetical protein MONOS_10673 [Monocercomonoides exilis]|eukprot:MONOS_10673.1-p1 / transcript=MONOS_10673.1 / gene=MONOS_10673 / organism=Monocercomonoides_exilis_PA203 / gene_product=unspecified product / transcript_product=unspecified product / location=Mono_scaffold00493:43882-44229(-) / protein_length=116 / sequence_SO=supercontig / SO=protein_coding / is_pseudo=false